MTTQEAHQMTTHDVANRLVELCREGKYSDARQELYSKEIESIEPSYSPAPYLKGWEAVEAKGQQFQESVQEVHSNEVGEPVVIGNHFAVPMTMDLTMKDGNRMNMSEIAVYQVNEGKVVKEQFFF